LTSIRLKNPKESISGFYTCEVSNEFQTLTSTGFVRVKTPIDFNDDLFVIEFTFLSIKKKTFILDYHQMNFNLKLSLLMIKQSNVKFIPEIFVDHI
jgi:hypothetical protein